MKRKSAVNRILLALTGIVLLGGGLLMLAGSFDLYRSWRMTPPRGWPLTDPRAVLLTRPDQTRWTDEGWWWPTVIAVLAIVVLLALWWLLAQLRRTHPGRIPVGARRPRTVWSCVSAPSATPWPPMFSICPASCGPARG